MAENRTPTGFSSYLRTVFRRAFIPFAWTRDILIATAVALVTVFIQAHWNLIPDWGQHKRQLILSYVIPYAVILVPHWLYRLAEAPWRVHQELESNHWSVLDAAT